MKLFTLILGLVFTVSCLHLNAQSTLYGMTSTGGSNGKGVIFKTDANGNNYTVLYNFNTANGYQPEGSLMKATNGKLYGTARLGGAMNSGVIFEFDPITNIYTKKIDFNGSNGSTPIGVTLVQSSNGKMYGTTYDGGVSGFGTLFEYDPVANTCVVLTSFSGTSNGARPFSGVVLVNDKLYGMTRNGGAYSKGVIFEYNLSTNTFVKKKDFAIGGDGYGPLNTFLLASNGKLYGLTELGGLNDKGVIFEYDYLTNTYTKRYDFSAGGTEGTLPRTELIQATDGKFYGTTPWGGNNNWGVIYQFDPTTSVYTKKVDFQLPTSSAQNPGTLMQTINGKFFGMTYSGGTGSYGTFYEYDLALNTYTIKENFVGNANGSNPAYWTHLLEVCTAPQLSGTISGDATICSGTSYIYQVSPVPNATSYSWTLPSGWSGSSTTETITVTPTSTSGNLVLTATNVCGSTSLSSNITVVNPPSVSVTGAPSTLLCAGESVTLTASGADTYNWDTSETGSIITVTPPTTTTYSVIGTDAYGCMDTTIAYVTVNQLPTVEIVSSDTLLCVGQSAILTVSGADTYSWEIGGTGSTLTVNPTITTPYGVTGTDVNGCESQFIYIQNVSDCAGIGELSEQSFMTIAPNPFANELYFKSVSTLAYAVHISDVFGKTVYQKSAVFGDLAVNLEILNSGVYYIQITDNENRKYVHRVIKE